MKPSLTWTKLLLSIQQMHKSKQHKYIQVTYTSLMEPSTAGG